MLSDERLRSIVGNIHNIIGYRDNYETSIALKDLDDLLEERKQLVAIAGLSNKLEPFVCNIEPIGAARHSEHVKVAYEWKKALKAWKKAKP